MKLLRKYSFVFLCFFILLITGCKSNTDKSIDNSEVNTINITQSKDVDLVDAHYKCSENIDDDLFYKINDVKYINDNLYILGFVVSDENSFPELSVVNSLDDVVFNYTLEQDEQFYYYNDIIYTFKYRDDFIDEVTVIDVNTCSTEQICINQLKISAIKSIFASNDTIYILDGDLCLHGFDNRFENEIKSDVSDVLSGSYKLYADSKKNVYLLTADDNKTVVYKYNRDLKLEYKSDDYTDMPGLALDIFEQNDSLHIQTINEGYVYTNVIDESNGKTLSRENIYEYNADDAQNITIKLKENEDYIGKSTNGCYIIIKYPEFEEYYGIEKRDKDGNIIDIRKLVDDDSKIISNMLICNNSDVLYCEETYNVKEVFDEKMDSFEHIIHRIKEDGSDVSFNITSFNSEKYPLFIDVDDDENVYIIEEKDGNYLISSYNKNGELIYKTENENNILTFLNSVVINNELHINYISYDEKYVIQKINSKGELKEQEESGLFYNVYPGNSDYDIFITDGKNIYGYDVGTKKAYEILSLVNCGIEFTPLDFFEYNDGFIVKDNKTYYLLTKDDSITTKQIIKLSGINLSPEIKNQVIDFNSKNDKYMIECIDYSSEVDSINSLNLDVISQKTDMIVFNNLSSLKAENYNSFLFTDLSKFLLNEPDINLEEYFSNVINLYRSNNKLYTLVTEFNVYSMIKRGTDGNQFITVDDYINNNIKITDYRFGLEANMLSSHIKNKTFVDNDFSNILKFLKDNVVDIAEGEKVNFSCSVFTDENDDEYYGSLLTQSLFQTDSNVSYCGFPSNTGNGIVAESIESISILDNSKNKDGAWEFLKYCLSDDYQNNLYRGIPVKKSAFDKVFSGDFSEKKRSLEVINSADCKYIGNTELFNIIWEESMLYFNDDKTLDDTVNAIKNKTMLYLSETDPAIF